MIRMDLDAAFSFYITMIWIFFLYICKNIYAI